MKYTLHSLMQRLKSLIVYGSLDPIKDFNIEINTNCNRMCSYCPNSVYKNRTFGEVHYMDERLYRKLINELARIKFDGRITPMFSGEPLMHPRLVQLLAYAKKRLPNCRIKLYTNGDMLTVQKYLDLVRAGVDEFKITQHSKYISKTMKRLFMFLAANPEKKVKMIYQKFDDETPLFNRGGIVNPKVLRPKPRCMLDDNPIIVDYQGNIVLCCNDYFGTVKFGNIREKSLVKIWKSKFYRDVRKKMRKGVCDFDVCKRCRGLIR